MAKKKVNAPEFPAEAHEKPAAEKKERSNAPPQVVRGPKGVPSDAIIRMGVDKEGRHYGPDNNPKKQGSKTYDRFNQYVDGMTIAQALDAGLQTADLVYDRDKGFISFGTQEHSESGSHGWTVEEQLEEEEAREEI